MIKTHLFLAYLFCAFSLFAQTPQEKIINDLLKQEALKQAHIGFMVESKRFSLIHQADKAFMPASTLKLLTTAAAYEVLTEDYKFETKVYLIGKQNAKKWEGYLLIKGFGDPGFASDLKGYLNLEAVFEKIIIALKSLKIEAITEGIVIDPYWLPYFEKVHDHISGGVVWEDIGNYYAAGLFGFNFNQNSFEVQFEKQANVGDSVKILKISPAGLDLKVINKVLAGPVNSGDQTYISPSLTDGSLLIQGTIPAGSGTFSIKGSINNPPLAFANLLRAKLKFSGIENAAILIQKTEDLRISPLLTFSAPSLINLIEEANQKSNNLISEGLHRAVAQKLVQQTDLRVANEAIAGFWKSKFEEDHFLHLTDGSGLSRTNLITPRLMTQILQYILTLDSKDVFLNSLSTAGVSGTLSTFCTQNSLKGNLKGKSGSMSKVLCYAGVFNNKKGERVYFTIFVNHFNGKTASVKKVIEHFLASIYEL